MNKKMDYRRASYPSLDDSPFCMIKTKRNKISLNFIFINIYHDDNEPIFNNWGEKFGITKTLALDYLLEIH